MGLVLLQALVRDPAERSRARRSVEHRMCRCRGILVLRGALSKRGLLWGIPALVWLSFAVWYTDFGGPLTDAEIAHALSALERRGMDAEVVMCRGKQQNPTHVQE